MALVDALIRAQSGYRSDLAALVEELNLSEVFAPLGSGADLPSTPTTLEVAKMVKLHNLPSADGKTWAALFSGVGRLQIAGVQFHWTTDGGPLRFMAFKWDDAIQGMFLPAIESGGIAGIVFDVGGSSELALNASEMSAIARGEMVPLIDYASQHPARGDEQVFIGEPATAPPATLVDAIQTILATEPAVISHHLRQVYIPERDLMPHLILDIHSQASEAERRRISQRVGEAIDGIPLPPPGYVDVAFNFVET